MCGGVRVGEGDTTNGEQRPGCSQSKGTTNIIGDDAFSIAIVLLEPTVEDQKDLLTIYGSD